MVDRKKKIKINTIFFTIFWAPSYLHDLLQ